MKGASDGGVFIPHGENRFPGYDAEAKELDAEVLRSYIYGGHVADYMRYLEEDDDDKYKKQFSKFIAAGVDADDLEEMYQDAHNAIREDPTHVPTDKKKPAAGEKVKNNHKTRLTYKQKKNKIQQKVKAFQAKNGISA
jgi:large subunit ribosomal protein L5e